MMSFKNLIKYAVGSFLVLLLASSYFWYSYPELKISFFLSGNGAPVFEFAETLYDGSTQNAEFTPVLSETPTLYSVPLKTSELKALTLNISNYDGAISIEDVFVGGQNFKHLFNKI